MTNNKQCWSRSTVWKNCFFLFLILDYLLDYPSFSHVKEYDGPVHIQYASYPARFNTFNDWPIGLNQKPGAMAKAGFFYTGKNLIIFVLKQGEYTIF